MAVDPTRAQRAEGKAARIGRVARYAPAGNWTRQIWRKVHQSGTQQQVSTHMVAACKTVGSTMATAGP